MVNINANDALCMRVFLHSIGLNESCDPLFITVSFIIYGVHSNKMPCKNELLFDGPMLQLRDSNYATCVTPLQGGPMSARITVKSESPDNTFRVLLVVSPHTRCYSPGITVAAKPCGSEMMVECSPLDENNSLLLACPYLCSSTTLCGNYAKSMCGLLNKNVTNYPWPRSISGACLTDTDDVTIPR